MAQEIKNTFLKSKMNKDLDDRILTNGEYRDARNISVGRSEDNDVGALENIIGNDLVAGTDIGNGLTIIGVKTDNSTDKLFIFLTDYTDPNVANPTNAPSTSKHYIYSYNNATKQYTRLVQGEFLNFSTTNRIVGINLLEDLLFWTDDRNQPRKINVNFARAYEPGQISIGEDYYTQEHQISVAKYNPYKSIQLYNRADLLVRSGATQTQFTIDGHRRAELIDFIGATVVCAETIPITQGTDYIKVVSIFNSLTTPNITTITVSSAMQAAPAPNDFVSLIKSTMSNKNSDSQWPGDPDFLEDKFVRFSYRFKFDDNEYSIMAPFTQIAYIPKQNGYFLSGDENAAYQSTVVSFMENSIQNIGLIIPLPASANRLLRDYKVSEIEILFRESDAVAVKVLESVSIGEVSGVSGNNNYYTYEYQSRKPYRTLPEAQTVRVYDKVPVRALAQESSGNRIIYGNFRDKHTPPASINYNCRVAPKSSTGAYNNWVEYPNSSVKRNRNYQIGFVLSDKFGRQSPVILSSVDNGTSGPGGFYSGSTIYSSYDINPADTNPSTWFGDALQVLVNQPISSEINLAAGTPGLYAIKQQETSTGEGFAITDGFASAGVSPITNTTWTFTLDVANYPNNGNVPQEGNSLRGAYEDFVKVTNVTGPSPTNEYVVTTTGRVSDTYLRTINLAPNTPDLKFAYVINDLGWYSYKIVVKQTEQEYYNVYLPGILNGYPGQDVDGEENGPFPTNELNLTAHTVLLNDNINKVPRDLSEVGPDQKQFRSSAVLYGVVTNIMNTTSGSSPEDADPFNTQYYPRLDYTGRNALSHTATTIATAKDLDMGYSLLSGDGTGPGNPSALDGNLVFYQIDTNPLIARISTTEKSIGWPAELSPNPSAGIEKEWNMQPYLAIYETAPTESLLNIYWETTSEGLIVDLNSEVASTNSGVAGFVDVVWEFKEDITKNTPVTLGFFSPIDNQGQLYAVPPSGELVSVSNSEGSVGFFQLVPGEENTVNEGKFQIVYTGDGIVFTEESIFTDVYTFLIRMTTSTGEISEITLGGEPEGEGALQNVAPSFNTLGNIAKTQDTITLIPGASFSNAENGTSLGPPSNKQDLVFSFYGTGGVDLPSSWQMVPESGELTQLPNEVPIGEYDVTIRVTDVNAIDPDNIVTPAYTSLYYEEQITIRIDYTAVNSEVISDNCLLQPGISQAITQALVPTSNNGPLLSRIWYIAAQQINNNQQFINDGITVEGEFFDLAPGQPIRIGTGAHSKGTISFTMNTRIKDNGSATNSVVRNPYWYIYYREEGTATWIPMPREYELNRVGNYFPDTGATYSDNLQSDRPYLTIFDNFAGYPYYGQGVRAFDYNSFNTSSNIEYAILCDKMQQIEGWEQTGPNFTGSFWVAWVQADDLNNPTCVPWQGFNLVSTNAGASPYFKYLASDGSNSSVNFNNTLYIPVYSKIAFGDYVSQLFNDDQGETIFTTQQGENYINLKLDRTYLTPNPPQWTIWDESTTPALGDLQWVVGFSDSTGIKITNPNLDTGVSAFQVSGNLTFPVNAGTARKSTNFA